MTSLADFLRARLEEDEQAAHEAATEGGHWSQQAIGVGRRRPIHYVGASPDPHVARSDSEVARGNYAQIARHIALHDPARVLREVEAKRRQIDLALALIEQETGHPGATLMMRQAGEDMLRTMAAIHRDHEDYSEDLPL